MNGLKLVREYIDSLDCNLEPVTEGSEQKHLYVSGITIQMELKNGNSRYYRRKPTSDAVYEHVKSFMKDGRAVGELNHPTINKAQINPENISHRFVQVEEHGNDFYTKALVLDTPKGMIVQNLHKGGVKLGISSRALAELTESDNIQYVEKCHIVSLGDIVFHPSAPQAFVQGVMEGKEWIYENGLYVEKDISEEIDTWTKRFRNMNKSEYNSTIVTAFREYLDTLLLK